LFENANHVPNSACEKFTDLELFGNAQAKLIDGLGGRCALTAFIDPNERAYTLRQAGTDCGSRIFEGSRRVDVGPSTTGLATIKIIDHRSRQCRDLVPAKIIVEETTNGTTTTKYSQDRVPQQPAEHVVVSCVQPNIDHGASVDFHASGPAGEIVRAEYKETTRSGTQVVANMNVCAKYEQSGGPGGDIPRQTVRCNDTTWIDGHVVELWEGGFAGIPSIKLYKLAGNAGERILLHSLTCQYVTP
jgi:hypothetical protein